MLPSVAPLADLLAGLAALAAGWRLKFVLVRRAAYNQGFSLPQLPVRGSH
jgi:phenylacetyl-CoA:acceptor oxidoreductase 26-kDa subunit